MRALLMSLFLASTALLFVNVWQQDWIGAALFWLAANVNFICWRAAGAS